MESQHGIQTKVKTSSVNRKQKQQKSAVSIDDSSSNVALATSVASLSYFPSGMNENSNGQNEIAVDGKKLISASPTNSLDSTLSRCSFSNKQAIKRKLNESEDEDKDEYDKADESAQFSKRKRAIMMTTAQSDQLLLLNTTGSSETNEISLIQIGLYNDDELDEEEEEHEDELEEEESDRSRTSSLSISPEFSFSPMSPSSPLKKIKSSHFMSKIYGNSYKKSKCKDPIGDEIRKLEEKQNC